MPAIPPYIIESIQEQLVVLLPQTQSSHPLGCHRPRIPNRIVFEKLVQVLVFGCVYEKIADPSCSASTLRRRRDEWIASGVIDLLCEMALEAYDRMVGLEPQEYDVSDVVDGDGTYSFILRSDSVDLAKFDAWEGFYQPKLVVTLERDPVLVGAGDMASSENPSVENTADLLGNIAGTVFTAGDNAYESGSIEDFERYYSPTWGRHKARTKPSPGNHEYVGGKPQQFGAGYFDYFGAVAVEGNGGYYSYDLGKWHVISLNTGQCYGDLEADGSHPRCGPGDPMIEWLKRDLATSNARCTMAYFHHPRWSSGVEHGNDPASAKAIWDALYDGNAEVVVSGHDHDYERFAAQDAQSRPDDERGIRQFVVGTGGRGLRGFGDIEANSEVRSSAAYGVIKFTLRPGSCDWEFVPVGSDQCH